MRCRSPAGSGSQAKSVEARLVTDVVAVGIITGAVGLAGNLITWFVARHQGAVELDKLRQEHVLAARRDRSEHYRRLLKLSMQRIGFIRSASGEIPDVDQFLEALVEAEASVALAAPEPVMEAFRTYGIVLADISEEYEKLKLDRPDQTHAQLGREAWHRHRERADAAQQALVRAMRDDINSDPALHVE